MTTQRVNATVSNAQDIGGAQDGTQRERVRSGVVRTADGSRIQLAVVAVGTKSGDSAARVVEQVFQAVSGSEASNLAVALKRGLEITSPGLARQGDEVSASAVAMRRGTAFFASAGNIAVFRVAGPEAMRLTTPSISRLGTVETPKIQAGPAAGIALQRGDRMVVASAGIFDASPEDGKPFVDPNAIPGLIKNLPPQDAAKHLVSIALGRDVATNVSVAVLGEARGTRRWPAAALVAAGIVGVLLLIVGGLTLFRPSEAGTGTDFGFAVLVRGGVMADTGSGLPSLLGNLDAIPAGGLLTAQTDATLGLQSTYGGGGELPGASIYLAPGAVVRLSEIDLRASDGRSGPTRLALSQGSVLISRQFGTWEYRIEFEGNESILSGAGPGAMGVVSNNGSGHQLFCLKGICRFESEAGGEVLLSRGERVLVQNSSGILEEDLIDAAAISQWDRMCRGCLDGNQ